MDVTVVIPTRNRAALLAGALRSALSQRGVSLEVIVVDDGSTDATGALLISLSPDARVKTIRHETARGVAAARNRGMREAHGQWLAFLDDDDLWAPTWLRTALDTASRSNADLAYGSRWIVDGHRRVTGVLPAHRVAWVHDALYTYNAIGGPSGVVVCTDIMRNAGGFDERLSALADWDAWLRLIEVCRVAPVPDFLVAYTIYRDNMDARDPFGVLAELDVFANIVTRRNGGGHRIDVNRYTRSVAINAASGGHRVNAARLWLAAAWRSRRPANVLHAGLAFFHGPATSDYVFATPAWVSDLANEGIGPAVRSPPGGITPTPSLPR